MPTKILIKVFTFLCKMKFVTLNLIIIFLPLNSTLTTKCFALRGWTFSKSTGKEEKVLLTRFCFDVIMISQSENRLMMMPSKTFYDTLSRIKVSSCLLWTIKIYVRFTKLCKFHLPHGSIRNLSFWNNVRVESEGEDRKDMDGWINKWTQKPVRLPVIDK